MLNIFTVLIGVLTSALGVMVLIGWYTHNINLIQVNPSLVPMQYNTALGFFLSGIGLISIALNRHRLALVVSVIIGVIALLTLIEYFFGVDLGIDQLLMRHYITTKTAHPGRMAPTTALSFLLTSGALLFASLRILPGQRPMVLGFLCSFLFALGTGTLLVYMIGSESPAPFGLASFTFMALHTSIGFIVLSIGVFLYILRESPPESVIPPWLPMPLFLILFIISLGLWNAMRSQEIDIMMQALKRRSGSTETLFKDEIESYSKALIRMAKRWEHHYIKSTEIMSKEEWQFDAENYINSDPVFLEIAWIDPSFHVGYIEPEENISSYQEMKPGLQEPLRNAMESAKKSRQVRAKYYNESAQDDEGLVVFVPIYSMDNFGGLIMGVINLRNRLEYLLERTNESNFSYEFYDGDDIIYASAFAGKETNKEFSADKEFKLYGESWHVRVFPTPLLISDFRSPLPNIILVFSILVTVLLPLAVLLYQKSNIHAKELEKTNIQLEQKITERKRAEKRFHDILEAAPDASVIVNKEGMIVMANVQTEKLFGRSRDELVGKPLEMLIPDRFRASHVKHFERYFLNPTSRPMGKGQDLYGLGKDGCEFPVEISLGPLENEEEILVSGSIRDITERKRRDELLRESEERFRGAFENSAIGMSIVSPEGRWLRVNSSLCEITGYSEEELLVTDFQTITHPDDLEADLNRVRKMLNGEITTYNIEKRYIHKHGHTVWILLNVLLVHDPKGNPLYFISQIQDITKRKRAEEELTLQTKRLARSNKELNILNNTIQTLNQSIFNLEEVYELSAELVMAIENVDMAMIYFVDENKKEAVLRAHRNVPQEYIAKAGKIPYPKGMTWKIINTKEIVNIEDIQNDPSLGDAGRMLGHHGVLGVPISVKEKVLGVMWVITYKQHKYHQNEINLFTSIASQIQIAINNAIQAEELQTSAKSLAKKAKELELSNTELEQFAYVASHDLQEPLRMVSSYIQILERRYKDKLDSDASEFIKYAADGAKRMQLLINELLTYSRVTTRGNVFKSANLEDALDDALSNLKLAIEESGAAVIRDPLPHMAVDSMQITQLFQNLIGNGIKYCDSRRPEIHIGTEKKNGEWLFWVKDNGIGIDPKHFERVFIIFQRLHTRDKYEGTGMGLAMCKKIVERHGGRIWLESEPGKGSTFYFTMPYDNQRPKEGIKNEDILHEAES